MEDTCRKQVIVNRLLGTVALQGFFLPQVMGNRRFLQITPYEEVGINLICALEGYSSWQVLMQSMMNSIQEFDGTDMEAIIPWLDHIKAIAKKLGFDPLEVGMSKLEGITLCNVNVVSIDGNLSWFRFHQLLIEHYSNVLYVSDTLNASAHILQGESESVTQYLVQVKVLLECIHTL